MSLSKTITLSVNDYNINLSSNIKFYKNDQLKLIFEINGYGINVMNGVRVKTLMPVAPLNAILFIETPLGIDSIESATIEDNAVTFYLSSAQTQHVGVSRMQIQLSDEDGCQITLPPFEFEIRENIYDGEVALQQVLLADEDNNVLVDENGNALNTGTQVSSQTYSVALSTDETKTASSIPTKQIQDYNLKISVEGTEDLLIQDNGVTKRIKSSELMNSVDLTGYATESYVQTKIAEASLGGEVDLSSYATKDELTSGLVTKANTNHTHSQYLTSIPSEYVTETELNTKGYLTEHQDISHLATKTELSGKANTSDIPSLDGYATETYVTNKIAEASLSGGEVDLSGLATKDELNAKADKVHTHTASQVTGLSTVATSGSYNDLTNKPTITNGQDGEDGATFIPSVDAQGNLSWTNNGGLSNPSPVNIKGAKGDKGDTGATGAKGDKGDTGARGADGLTTSISLNGSTYNHVNGTITLPNYPTVPTNTSDLTNDSGFITAIPDEYITETELTAKGYLVQSDIAGKANTSDLATVATSGSYNDLTNKPTIPSAYTLPTASSTTLGGIKVGSGLSIDSNGILSATSSGSGSSTGNGIIFNDTYVENCNTWLSNGYIKTSNETTNLPSLCTGADRWGVLFYIAENTTTGTGTQMYFPIDGTYKGRVFTRSLTRMSSGSGEVGEWNLLARQSDLEGYATETYVNNKTTPRLVGDSVSNSTLTLTTDKYQYATLSNGNSIVLPTVSSFTEIHLFFKASSDLTLTFPSVRWQSIPSITSGHTYEIVFTYVVDEWLAGIICYQ